MLQIGKRYFVLILLFLTSLAASERKAFAQQPDTTRLVHPEVAERLSLSESQRLQLQQIMLERAEALARATDQATRTTLRGDFETRALSVLTAQQQSLFAKDQPSQKLFFQFSDMKWEQVLNWFANQQDLTLIMDRIPPGSFTYSDSRSYSPAEAIDLLNSVLLTRGFTLVRRQKMLTVMELSDTLPIELIPKVKLDELIERGRFELVSVQFPLGGRSVEAVITEIKPYLNSYGRAIPLASGTQVMVIENAGKMQTINELIAAVPVPKKPEAPATAVPAPKPVMASYPLSGLDATATLAFIRKLIPSENINVDDKAGILSAFVIPEQQTAIQSALDAMREKLGDSGQWQSVAYRLNKMTALEFKNQVTSLVPQAKVLTTTEQGLVIAAFADQETIRKSLAELQVEPVLSDRNHRSISVGKLLASQVETALKKFLPNSQIMASDEANSVIIRGSDQDISTADEIVKNWIKVAEAKQSQLHSFALERKANAEWLATVAKIIPTAKTWLREDGKELLILSDLKDIAAIESVLPQLLTLLPRNIERKLKIYSLSKQQKLRRASLTTSLPTGLSDMTFTEVAGGQELLVWGTDEQHVQYSDFLKLIDQPSPLTAPLQPQGYELKMQDTVTVMTLLTAEFSEAKLSVNEDGTRLTALAEPLVQEKIQARIAQLNQLMPSRAEKQLETYQVPGLTAVQLQTALGTAVGKATVQVDAQHSRLLVWATTAEHKNIASIVRLLGETPAVDVQKVVVVYPLSHVNATAVKTLLTQLDAELVVIADDKLKQIAVTATIAKQAIVQTAVKQMDQTPSSSAPPEVRGYDVKSYQAAQLLPTLQSLWPDMKLAADSSANKIVASGTPKELDQFSQAIERMLSAPAGKQPIVRSYPVPAGDLTTLPAILTQIAPQSTISSDVTSRTVTVLATEEMHLRVKDAIEQLSQAIGQAKKPASYSLKPTQLTAAQTALVALFPGISTAVDSTTGQLIVVANAQIQDQVASVVELLASGPNASDRTLRVFRLDPERVELTNFLTSLQTLAPSQVKLELNAQTGTLVAIGTETDIQSVAAQIEKLKEQLPAPSSKNARIYKLLHSPTASAVVILQATFPKAVFVQDPSTRTITATTSAEEHLKIQELLNSFDQPLTPKTYTVRPTQLTSVQTSLRALFPTLEMTGDALTGQVVIVASDNVQQQVSKIIELLINGPNPDEKVVKVYPLRRAWLESTTFLTTLKSIIPTQVTLDTSVGSDSLLAIGTKEELEKVERQLNRLESELPPTNDPTSVVYRLQHVPTSTALTLLQPLIPKATLVQDATSKTIAVTARSTEHQKISELLKNLDLPTQNGQTTKVYRFKRGSGRAISVVLRELMADARLFGDADSGTLLATATAQQHADIQEIVNQYEGSGKMLATRVFTLGKADSRSLQTAIQELTTEAKVSADRATNSLIVTAPVDDLPRIEQIVTEVEGSSQDTAKTAFYPVITTDPTAMAKSLQVNFPKASIVGDATGGGIFATANEQEHAAITQLIEQVNLVPSKLPTLKAFKIVNVRAAEVAKGLQEAFGKRSDNGVTIHEPTNSVFVVGTRESLHVAEQIVQQLDVQANQSDEQYLQVLDTLGLDGSVAVQAIESAFRNQPSSIEVRFDKLADKLFILANAQQHAQVKGVLESLRPAPRELKVVSTSGIDPLMAKEAIDALYFDTPYDRSPRVTIDHGQQQLLIKATDEQQTQIARLLQQMSQGPVSLIPGVGRSSGQSTIQRGAGSNIRFIPMQRNSKRLLEEIQKVWPEIRKNQLKVFDPSESQSSRSAGGNEPIQLVSTTRLPQQTTEAKDPNQPQAKPAEPPVVVVIGNDQWTIASEDLQALDEIQRLIELMRSSPAQPYLTTGNYSVYLLQRASASEVSQTLDSLLQPERTSERRLPSSYSELARRIKIIPDTRTNALIVSGSPSDRRVIEELLGVLDSDELIGSLQQLLPTTIALTSANATQVETVLKTIYRSQLSTSSSRKPIQIPEGVSAEMTTLLQQLNAESASPLLTLTSEETTNSIILRAPLELTAEIRKFVMSLDKQTSDTPSRRVDLIRLQSTNTEAIGAALRRLLSK